MHTVLLTGGMGYIGSHCAVALLDAGYRVILVDNLSNSFETAEDHIKKALTHSEAAENLQFYHVDLANRRDAMPVLRGIFQVFAVDAVIHLAAYKSVPESVADPLRYYRNNLFSLVHLLEIMDEFGVHRLIFSSSATVYAPATGHISETGAIGPSNPYGRTKWFGEGMCEDMASAWSAKKEGEKENFVSVVSLRYGNPVNSHPSGLLPETPVGPAMNLFNVAMEVVERKRSHLKIFGTDYPTSDGSGVRDYIHVVDLADAHVATLQKMLHPAADEEEDAKLGSYQAINVGIGRGFSVFQMLYALEAIHKKPIPRVLEARRPGDVASVVFDVSKAERLLGWRAKFRTIQELCQK